MHSRIWEIDFFRGIAIILMVLFHLIVDLKDFYGFSFEYLQGFWYYEGKLSAVMFIILAGISTGFSKNVFRHGVKVLGWGMVLTLITYFYNPTTYIRFGILHLIGVSLIVYSLFSKIRFGVLAFCAIVILLIGNMFIYKEVTTPYLFPFGLITADFISIDYYPLLPWSGIFLWGAVAGRILYSRRQSLLIRICSFDTITILGRNSLMIYLIHQPIILAVLYLLHALAVF